MPEIANILLASLPRKERDALLPELERVALELGHVIHEPQDSVRHVYFPNSGVVSMVTILDDRSVIEVGTVGNDGMIGLPIFLGVNRMITRAVVQVPGEAMRMTAGAFKEAARQGTSLHDLLHIYTYTLISKVSCSIACIRYHGVEKRLARWLLRIRDHVQEDEFRLTQQFLSLMVGAKRPHITTAAGKLQKAGLISYHRGAISVLDRDGLQTAACDCYQIIKKNFDTCFRA